MMCILVAVIGSVVDPAAVIRDIFLVPIFLLPLRSLESHLCTCADIACKDVIALEGASEGDREPIPVDAEQKNAQGGTGGISEILCSVEQWGERGWVILLLLGWYVLQQ